jgi:hypothetical protein
VPAQTAIQHQSAAGVAPTTAQSQRETALVEREANQLINRNQSELSKLPPGSLPPR